MEGVRLEDFEECEHTFYKSNELASITRLATPFHCQQQIDEHFFFMTLTSMLHQVSYLYPQLCILLGNFIFQNYCQELEQIQTSGEWLRILTSKLSTTSKDYKAYLKSEHKCLQDLCVEPPEVVKRAEYIDHLMKLYHLQ
jgi:Kyakuja-Dileera-Zisupton transposase